MYIIVGVSRVMLNTILIKKLNNIFYKFEDESKRRHAIQRFFICVLMFIIGLIMICVNLIDYNGKTTIIISALMAFSGLLGQVFICSKNIVISEIIIAITYGTMCIYFIITGCNSGFSILWSFMIPLGNFILFGLKGGIISNTLYSLFMFIVFWSPIHKYIYNYPNIFEKRFPVLFLSMFLFSLLVEWVRHGDFKKLSEANDKLKHKAYFDELTGAPNFNRFSELAKELLKENQDDEYSIMAIDIVNFKIINDKYGYEYGNDILISLTDELQKICGEKEIFARVNADRFVLLLRYEDKNLFNVRILKINEQLKNYNYKYVLRYNFGIYDIDNRNLDIWTLYDRAVMAKEIVQKKPRFADYNYYNEEIRKKLLNERFMEETMESALFNREFKVYYQPKYNLNRNEYTGAEALVRWQKSDGSIIPPGDFIAFFEKKGFITRIDMYVLREVCKDINKWINEGKKPVKVSVNVSKIDYYKATFLEDIIKIIDSYNIPHKYIELEMTETLAAENLQEFIEFASKCRNAGFEVSMDDFGSGYSSLTMLKDLPIDIIKLDKSMFIDNILDERFIKAKVIIEHIINLCKELNIEVVAEGIETKEVVEELRKMKCDLIQGYYFGKPMELKEFEELIYKK